MKLTFTKGPRKYDRLQIVHADGKAETIDCPKQGIIPHDMVHYAVEDSLRAMGFLGRVGAGEAASMRMQGEAWSDAVERLVEVFQGDAWSGSGSTPEAMIEMYRVTCFARECPMLALDAAAIETVRARIAALTQRWRAVAVGESLELEFETAGLVYGGDGRREAVRM